MAKEQDPPPKPATFPTARSSISRSLSHASTALRIERAAAMISKLATFRSKRTSNQKDSIHLLQKGKHVTSKLDIPYGLSKPILADETDSEASYGKPVLPNSDASPVETHISDGSSSLSSFQKYATYDGKESQTTSVLSEETDAGPSVLLPYEDAEEQFLEDYEGYFLHLSVDNIRKDQYPKLELQRIVYLDYASCPLYSRYQQHMQFLLEETDAFLGSNYATEKQSALHNNYVDIASEHILNLLNTSQNEYSTIFTPGLPSCYHLFGEMYNLKKGTHVLASPDHHKSIRHFIHVAARSKVRTGVIPLKSKDLCTHGNDLHKLLRKQNSSGHGCGLLIYPAQSFLSGVCHPLSWIVGAQQNGWEVLLDVSSCLPMVGIDLSLYQPEFVIGSLHHVLGYPSGVAFLLVRRSSHSICIEKGSAQLKLAKLPDNGKNVHVVTEGENLNTHIFAALSFGFEHLERIGIVAIQKRVESLITWLVKTLKSLKHKLEEKPLLQLYGSLDLKYRGSILAFNILDSTGNIFPARLVQQLAVKTNIFLGVGTLGDLTVYNILDQKSDKQVESASSYASTYNCEVIRLSLGPISTYGDVYRLAQFLSRFRDEDYMSSEAAGYVEELENEY
ncbi:molybdenum cofactor sulfurase-like isoform X2 [Phoenix dactylifera]|uniref:Molybdenum cofactor sulfurase-like isoform X2 n=1 Tax=Phoenix dactylifera TaxID=42345 RepID=A0A8B8JCI2_PHODC|nr:molybdenum cofactor sulfurase-like isoform X2 [Phoenix dactylifera]